MLTYFVKRPQKSERETGNGELFRLFFSLFSVSFSRSTSSFPLTIASPGRPHVAGCKCTALHRTTVPSLENLDGFVGAGRGGALCFLRHIARTLASLRSIIPYSGVIQKEETSCAPAAVHGTRAGDCERSVLQACMHFVADVCLTVFVVFFFHFRFLLIFPFPLTWNDKWQTPDPHSGQQYGCCGGGEAYVMGMEKATRKNKEKNP